MKWQDYFIKANQQFVVIAGPCSIESSEQVLSAADLVLSSGASLLRGGVYKLRTSPHSFQGMGKEALEIVKAAKDKTGLGFVAEITDPRQLADFEDMVDVIQVGSRNMYNYSLLKELGNTNKPVLLKRGFSATIDEWVSAAYYIKKAGNEQVILCERGIRGFDNKTRNVLDLGSVTYLKKYSEHIVFVDPSHASGDVKLVSDLAKAALFAGADGLMVEIHPEPAKALSDGPQALTYEMFADLMVDIKKLLPFVNRELIK